MKKAFLVTTVLVVGLALVTSTNCMRCGEQMGKKLAEKAIEGGTGGKAKVDLSGAVDLSALPDVVRYPNATGKSHWSITNEGKTVNTYVLETGDAASAVVAWYKTSLAGWKQSMAAESESGTVLTYATEEGNEFVNVLVASGEDGKTTITVTYSKKS